MEPETTPETTPESLKPIALGTLVTRTDPDVTLRRVRWAMGAGEWAYYLTPDCDVVIADTFFNPLQPLFAGRFEDFQFRFDAHNEPLPPHDVWILTKGWVPPPPEAKIWVEDEDEGLPRMERR